MNPNTHRNAAIDFPQEIVARRSDIGFQLRFVDGEKLLQQKHRIKSQTKLLSELDMRRLAKLFDFTGYGCDDDGCFNTRKHSNEQIYYSVDTLERAIQDNKKVITYERLIKILSLYRLTLGQARQEELLEYIFRECSDTDELKKLFINLSPYSKQNTNKVGSR